MHVDTTKVDPAGFRLTAVVRTAKRAAQNERWDHIRRHRPPAARLRASLGPARSRTRHPGGGTFHPKGRFHLSPAKARPSGVGG
jgi:hypothetical protein